MAIYVIGARTTNTTQNQSQAELIAGATGRNPRVLELGVIAVAATAASFAFGRPAAIGITPTTPATPSPTNPAVDAATLCRHALAWGTSPTNPTLPYRRWASAAVGAAIVWTFPTGLYIQPGSSLVLQNLAATATVTDVNWTFEE